MTYKQFHVKQETGRAPRATPKALVPRLRRGHAGLGPQELPGATDTGKGELATRGSAAHEAYRIRTTYTSASVAPPIENATIDPSGAMAGE
jgi:hypothetical protein